MYNSSRSISWFDSMSILFSSTSQLSGVTLGHSTRKLGITLLCVTRDRRHGGRRCKTLAPDWHHKIANHDAPQLHPRTAHHTAAWHAGHTEEILKDDLVYRYIPDVICNIFSHSVQIIWLRTYSIHPKQEFLFQFAITIAFATIKVEISEPARIQNAAVQSHGTCRCEISNRNIHDNQTSQENRQSSLVLGQEESHPESTQKIEQDPLADLQTKILAVGEVPICYVSCTSYKESEFRRRGQKACEE